MDGNSSELVKRMQKGDGAAFEKIFELYKVKAVRTAYLVTGNRSLSEDIAQEAFIQCFKKIGELRNTEQFHTWFFKMLTRLAWKMSKKEKSVVPVENIFEMADYQDVIQAELEFTKKADSEELMSLIEKLEMKQKTAIFLYYYNGFSVEETAKIMGCLPGTVKSRLHNARKNLKKNLKVNEELTKGDVNNAVIYKF